MTEILREKTIYDVVVIGGGPAGMMAAGRAAERGLKVLLLEKNQILGKKLLITGGGRCNVTNNKTDIQLMLSKYKRSGKFLFSAFSQFGVSEALEFFNKRGMPTKEEAEGRVFPVSNKAQSVHDCLTSYLKEGRVEVRTNASVSGVSVSKDDGNIKIALKDKGEVLAKSCVIATGGISRPETGSTGEGFKWLKRLGHKIVDSNFALVPIALKDQWAKKLGGVTLSEIKLTVLQGGEKKDVQKGKLLFTHFGVSGPTILNMSRGIGELLEYEGEVEVLLDLLPKLDYGALKTTFQNLLVNESNKKLKNTLGKIIPSALVSGVLELSEVNGETANHSIKSEERKKIMSLIKAIPLHVKSLLGEKAVVSSGGVALEEVDFKTMQSRIIPNLYLVGDVLNVDRPSGGYSLQLSWTSGYLAGENACRSLS